MDLSTLTEGPWCWRCMENQVAIPLLLCDPCIRIEDKKATRQSKRTTDTHERTHEKYRAPLEDADLNALRRWSDLTGN